jgi:hypothetical protein
VGSLPFIVPLLTASIATANARISDQIGSCPVPRVAAQPKRRHLRQLHEAIGEHLSANV